MLNTLVGKFQQGNQVSSKFIQLKYCDTFERSRDRTPHGKYLFADASEKYCNIWAIAFLGKKQASHHVTDEFMHLT